MYLALADARYRAYRKQEVSISEPEEAPGSNFQHLDLSLVLIDKQIAYMSDFFAMPIEHFTIADVLG
jgi:hypothetical protein